ncbi:hypothetical protein AOLI_G00054770 [Acnodon oligacanthus]
MPLCRENLTKVKQSSECEQQVGTFDGLCVSLTRARSSRPAEHAERLWTAVLGRFMNSVEIHPGESVQLNRMSCSRNV